ncbi:SMC-Scp complex subunit ScpB [Micromonospora sp. WMMC415]|uniref:SMC-Scp complex subunit ScpB n=1 Tax=Micromonospora sp. WMMC415 TaxID=2675222 RepID=UPI0012B44196|nr:SMC-Scp complex subunit ScpB [Micromonospora sp. WMMC415]QGN49252.1 SMC-Scp complex subunit ScpB [Micromonospora sp. WMMC415]
MSDEERRDSLADQAAAWIPPWERRPEPPAEPANEPPGEPATEAPAEAAVGQVTEDLGEERSLEGPEASRISGETASDGQGAAAEAAGAGAGGPSGAEQQPSGDAGEPETTAGEAGESAHGGEAVRVPDRAPRPRRRVPAPPEPAPVLDDAELRGALEAILLVVDEPVAEATLADVLEQPAERIAAMLAEIAAGYTAAGHGFELRRAAGGWRLYTRQEYAGYVERFVLDGQSVRLTQAALETLAVVAYKQPVTRSRISAIRGVNCDGVIRTLVSRGLVEECGTETESGAHLYRTTTLFLEKLGLDSVADLPPLAPFLPDDVEELADATR